MQSQKKINSTLILKRIFLVIKIVDSNPDELKTERHRKKVLIHLGVLASCAVCTRRIAHDITFLPTV